MQTGPVNTFSFPGNPEDRLNTAGGQGVLDTTTGTIYARPIDAPLGTNGYSAINTNGIATAQPIIDFSGRDIIYVSKGDAATDTRGDTSKYSYTVPFATLTAAKTAAVSGDLISVSPGVYDEHNLLKNGVNWYFCAGAEVVYTGRTETNVPPLAGIFDDSAQGANGPIVCMISGYGKFDCTNRLDQWGEHSALGDWKGVVDIRNAGSDIRIWCDELGSSAPEQYTHAITQATGAVSVSANRIFSSNSDVVWWSNGQMYVHANQIYSEEIGVCIRIADGGAPTGQMYVRAAEVSSVLGQPVLCTAHPDARVWIVAENLKGLQGVLVATGFFYLRAQKIDATEGQALSVYGECNAYIHADKLAGGNEAQGVAILLGNGCKAFISADEITNYAPTIPLVFIEENTLSIPSEITLRGFAISSGFGTVGYNGNGVIIHGGGKLILDNCNITSTSSLSIIDTGVQDVDIDPGTLILKNGTILVTPATNSIVATDNGGGINNVLVYNAFSNKAAEGGITPLVGTLVVDTDVQ